MKIPHKRLNSPKKKDTNNMVTQKSALGMRKVRFEILYTLVEHPKYSTDMSPSEFHVPKLHEFCK